MLLLSDSQRSVLGSTATSGRNYMPYGNLHAPSDTRLAFTGNYLDRVTNCYLLGNGYRGYSPSLMRFLSPDRLSPFAAGGCNSYAYCSADPVNRVDASGAAPTRNPSYRKNLFSQGTEASTGSSWGNLFDNAATSGNVAGVINAVVQEMESIQHPSAAPRTTARRVASASEFWSNVISAGNSLVSEGSLPGLPSYANALIAATGITTYVELPGRIHGVWQGSSSAREFGYLVLRGTARASGLDWVGNGVAQTGRVLLGTARAMSFGAQRALSVTELRMTI